VSFEIAAADKDPEQHACHVRVEDGRALTERETENCSGRVLADALEREQRLRVRRQLSAVSAHRLSRNRVQSAWTDVVAERPPRGGHIGLRRRGEGFHGRVLAKPLVVLRQYPIDLRLLQHHLRDEDVVRVGGLPPREIASIPPVPVEQPPPEPLAGRRNRHGRLGHNSRSSVVVSRTRRRFANPRLTISDDDERRTTVRIYTKTGDTGETALLGGTRVSKAAPRVAAYGDVDELNAWLGLVRAAALPEQLAEMIDRIQRDLFAIGARLADPSRAVAERVSKTAVTADDVTRLEGWIDQLEAGLKPLRRFILAGGTPAAASLHVARTVCRRAERSVVALGPDAIEPELLVYLNRLSDLLFVMARAANHQDGVAEPEW